LAARPQINRARANFAEHGTSVLSGVVLDCAQITMKRTTANTLFLIVVVIALLTYRLWRTRQSTPSPGLQTIAQCDQSLWQDVYHPNRLQVLNPCISVTGTVDEIRKEADGDFHILFRLDQQFESLLNEKNISRQYGDLILEPICQGQVTQADAVEPCNLYNGPYFAPEIGQRYLVWGTYVNDTEHGWNELHPVTSMQPIP
jgi:hypothetical protein